MEPAQADFDVFTDAWQYAVFVAPLVGAEFYVLLGLKLAVLRCLAIGFGLLC